MTVPFEHFTQGNVYECIMHGEKAGPLFVDRPSAEKYQKQLHEAGKIGSEIFRIPLWKARDNDD